MSVLLKILLLIVGLNISLLAFEQSMTEEFEKHPDFEKYSLAIKEGKQDEALYLKKRALNEINELVLKRFVIETGNRKDIKRPPVADIVLKWDKNWISGVTFTNDNKVISSSMDGTVKEWIINSPYNNRLLHSGDFRVRCVSYSKNPEFIVYGVDSNISCNNDCPKETVFLYDFLYNKEMPLYTHDSTITSIAVSSDGQLIISGGVDKTVKIFDIKARLLTSIKDDDKINTVAISSDSKLMAYGFLEYDNGKLKIYDIKSKIFYPTINAHYMRNDTPKTFFGGKYIFKINSLAFSPDNKYLASGSGDKTIKIWDIKKQREVKTLFGHQNAVMSIAFSPDNKYFASADYNGIVKIWDVSTWKEIVALEDHTGAVTQVVFSVDGKYIAAGGHDKTIMIWDMKKIEKLK